MTIKMITAEEARVGFTVTCSQAVFGKLLQLAGGPDATKDDWSAVIVKLIERAS